MKKSEKYLQTFLITLVIFLAVFVGKHALAEDEEENEREDDERVTTVIDTSPAKKAGKKTETITEYRKLSDTITQIITTITRHDSDGDGIYDDEDAHPTINDYFIVADDNLNGIDDRYE